MAIKTEGIQFLFELISEVQSAPANYYIGWCEEAESDIADTANLASLTELSGNGYGRIAIASDGTDLVSAAGGVNGRTLTTKEVTFTAAGGVWNLAKTRFLATSADDSGKLIATEPINSGTGIALPDGQSYDMTMILACEP